MSQEIGEEKQVDREKPEAAAAAANINATALSKAASTSSSLESDKRPLISNLVSPANNNDRTNGVTSNGSNQNGVIKMPPLQPSSALRTDSASSTISGQPPKPPHTQGPPGSGQMPSGPNATPYYSTYPDYYSYYNQYSSYYNQPAPPGNLPPPPLPPPPPPHGGSQSQADAYYQYNSYLYQNYHAQQRMPYYSTPMSDAQKPGAANNSTGAQQHPLPPYPGPPYGLQPPILPLKSSRDQAIPADQVPLPAASVEKNPDSDAKSSTPEMEKNSRSAIPVKEEPGLKKRLGKTWELRAHETKPSDLYLKLPQAKPRGRPRKKPKIDTETTPAPGDLESAGSAEEKQISAETTSSAEGADKASSGEMGSPDSKGGESSRPYACPHQGCRWAFARLSDLKRHMKSHQAPEFECPYWKSDPTCHRNGGAFNRLDVLKRHLKLVHFIQDKNRSHSDKPDEGWCRSCQKQFSDIRKFFNHIDECSANLSPTEWTQVFSGNSTTKEEPKEPTAVPTQFINTVTKEG